MGGQGARQIKALSSLRLHDALGEQGATAQLIDLTRRVLLTQALRTKQLTRGTRSLSAGAYLVWHSNGQVIRRTLIKE